MKSWYQSYQLTKYMFMQLLFILFFYIEVIRYGQNQDISYIQRYVEGIYVVFLILTYTIMNHHRNVHMILYLGKRVKSVYLKHIVSEAWMIIHMIGIIMIHFCCLLLFELPIIYIQLLMVMTVQYTVLSWIIFQISDHIIIRIMIQMITYMIFIYAEYINILKPLVWFKKYQVTSFNMAYALTLICILMMIRFLKYHLIRVRP